MEKEKIVLGNKVELPYDRIGFAGTSLVIGFMGGNILELEQAIRDAGQNNLEIIKQMDADGNLQMVHERFDIFSEIKKIIGQTAAEDVVEVVLSQETEIDMKIRHLEARMSSTEERVSDTEEVTDTLLMKELA